MAGLPQEAVYAQIIHIFLSIFLVLGTSVVSVFERAQSGSPEGRRLGVENLPLHLGQSDLHLDRIVGLHLGAFR